MRREDLGGRASSEDQQEVGDEALPVVREEAQRSYFGRVLAIGEADELEGTIDWLENVGRYEDGYWYFYAWRKPFTWQNFLNWWIARRYIVPRDVRRR